MLGAFNIKYLPHTAVKGQVLVDLVVEFTEDAVVDNGGRTECLGAFSPFSSNLGGVY